jgi:protein-tyrosine phosphatase
MIDIHSHILPEIDDGVRNWAEALEILKQASKEGITKICATPHFITDSFQGNGLNIEKDIVHRVELLNKLAEKEAIGIQILYGAEVYLTLDLVEKIKEGKIPTLNKTIYLLIELPVGEIPIYFEEVIFKIHLSGLKPIISHPERNIAILKDSSLLYERLLAKDVIIQMNAGSILGLYGPKVKRLAHSMLKNKVVHVIASDAHNKKVSNSLLKEAYEKAKKITNEEIADKLVKENPESIIKGKNFSIPEYNHPKRRKMWSLWG